MSGKVFEDEARTCQHTSQFRFSVGNEQVLGIFPHYGFICIMATRLTRSVDSPAVSCIMNGVISSPTALIGLLQSVQNQMYRSRQ
jgi:hypothetical protein